MKYSAGIKFNKNAELIIEADPNGTVTSCRNLSNDTEYINSSFVNVEITTDDGCTIIGPFVYEEEEIVCIVPQIEIPEGGGSVEEKIVILKDGAVLFISDNPVNIEVTGDASVNNESVYVTGDCTISITYTE